ncbi:MAG: IS1634 family transposase [Bacilli bacterium]
MGYFLKQSSTRKKGLYLQIYRSFYVSGKGGRHKSFQVIGYASDLKEQGIEDPISYANEIVQKLNANSKLEKEAKIGSASLSKNLGHFLLKGMLDYLEPDETLNIMSSNKKFQFKFNDFVRSMIYAQVVNPGSKHNAFEKVFPNMYNCTTFSYDQILETIQYIGNDYQKLIELFNHQIGLKWKRKTGKAFFDCTNYYFEIDLPSEDKQNGPSKENRHCPIISQALLLDENQIPLAMSMFPGNESEKPQIRKTIEDLKQRFDIKTKIVQIADKGLNCARNIYSASIESRDGYIFSKSVHGRCLSNKEKQWVRLDDNCENAWTSVNDEKGKMLYKYKSCIDDFEYKFIDDNNNEIKFTVKEKRVVSYNPALARKQKAAIQKQIDKARSIMSIKESMKDDYGDSIKYVNFVSVNNDGEVITTSPLLNLKKIEEDISYAGYNLLVSSELKKTAQEIYEAYHGLWRIEESFRVMKTYLEARPVYLQTKESIYGHFLICYLALTVLRLIELKVFNDKLPIGKIVEFIRNYNISEMPDGKYVNNATNSAILKAIQDKIGIATLDNLYLRKKDAENIFKAELF